MTAHAATPTQPSTYGSDSGRARLPDASGFAVSSDGVRLAYDVYGTGEPTIAFLPSTHIVHARQWKAQIPYLSRHFRVVAYDGRGNGRSDRPVAPESYADPLLVDDVLAVLDASDTPRALLVGLCGDAVWRAVLLAGRAPERVAGIVAFATGVPVWSLAAVREEAIDRLAGEFGDLDGFREHVGLTALRVIHHYLMGGWGLEDTTRPDLLETAGR